MDGIGLRQASGGWEFISEAVLEKFVWANLMELLGLVPIKQQYVSSGEVCDILAVDDNKRLTILELKNAEDRYVIQQLTRYYANMLQEKPFPQQIDYSYPPRLIAVAPSYHRHNFIDQEYSKLNFELFHFFILEERGDFYFVLKKGEDSSEFKKCLIPYQSFEAQTFEDVSPPPDMLIVWLSVCTKEEQEGFWKVRRKILLCHPKMKEMIADKNSIQYGSGKTKLCAEIAFQRKLQKPILFLWLPTPSTWNVYRWNDDKKPVIGRLRIWTNGQTISHVGHVPKGFGKMKTREEWEQMPPSKKPHRMFMGFSSQSHTPVEIKRYLQTDHRTEERDFWDVLSGLTIDRWLAKVQS